jgi:MFS family permease
VLIDRFGPSRIALWTAALGVFGATLTAIGEPYALMWCGRLIFGITEGAIFMALVAGLAQWFPAAGLRLRPGCSCPLPASVRSCATRPRHGRGRSMMPGGNGRSGWASASLLSVSWRWSFN